MLLSALAPVAIGAVLFGLAAVVLARRHRRCPTCAAPMHPIAPVEGPAPAYEVLVCGRCRAVATATAGHASTHTWCPACRNLSLLTTPRRLGDEEGQVRVEVEERCHLCGWEEERGFAGGPPPRGLVVDFREGRGRRR